eukprot:gene17322-biopygen23338
MAREARRKTFGHPGRTAKTTGGGAPPLRPRPARLARPARQARSDRPARQGQASRAGAHSGRPCAWSPILSNNLFHSPEPVADLEGTVLNSPLRGGTWRRALLPAEREWGWRAGAHTPPIHGSVAPACGHLGYCAEQPAARWHLAPRALLPAEREWGWRAGARTPPMHGSVAPGSSWVLQLHGMHVYGWRVKFRFRPTKKAKLSPETGQEDITFCLQRWEYVTSGFLWYPCILLIP